MATRDAEQLEDLARNALASGDEEAALAELALAPQTAGNARLLQFTGLLQRSLDRHADALRSFTAAARLAPDDPGIAQGLARVALEAGVQATPLFERALELDRSSGSSVLGLVAAKFASGRGAEAEAQLDLVVARSPTWIDGHAQLGQLRSMLGRPDQATASIERALIGRPSDEALWTALMNLKLSQNDFYALEQTAARARRANVAEALVMPFEAVAASELGQSDRADRLFDAMTGNQRHSLAIWEVRHLLRTGRVEPAIALIDRELAGKRAAQLWPYASVAWRLAGDQRWDWLEADGALVSTVDLAGRSADLDALAARLRSLHATAGEYLDQSVRGGTQTDGPLLSRIDPEIQALRSIIVGAVHEYRRRLPPVDPAHPLLRERRDRRIRFAGSWSVRLRGSGYHANHVHPQGWLSSAFYVSLPDCSEADGPQAGWLKLGEPPAELGLNLAPVRVIQPAPGLLTLFPSWMWHGTIPFPAGERLTVAFDVQVPK